MDETTTLDLPALQRVVALHRAAVDGGHFTAGQPVFSMRTESDRIVVELLKATLQAMPTVGALLGEVAELRRIRALLLNALALATGTTEDAVREGPTGCAAETAAELARLRRRDAIVQTYIDELGDVDTTDDGRVRVNHWMVLEGELGERSTHVVVSAAELARLRRVEAAATRWVQAKDALYASAGGWMTEQLAARAEVAAADKDLRDALTEA